MARAATRVENQMASVAELRTLLARELIGVQPAERLPTVREFAALTGASVGSVQAALAGLVADNAITIRRRGHLGTFLTERDVARLWYNAEQSPIVVAYPLSSTARVQGLATAIKGQLREAGLEAFSIFVSGARARLDSLHAGRCHAAVLSELSVDAVGGPDVSAVLKLPTQSYIAAHQVLRRRDADDPPRVAVVDPLSVDQELLTQTEFEGTGIEIVHASAIQFPPMLKSGKAQVAVWNAEEIPGSLVDVVERQPLSRATRARIGDRDTRAQVVTLRSAGATERLLSEILDRDHILEIQQALMDGQVVPEY